MIFSTHRSLFKLRPGWGDGEDCAGRMMIAPESMAAGKTVGGQSGVVVWEATCDECGLEIGVPPRQQRRWQDRGAGS